MNQKLSMFYHPMEGIGVSKKFKKLIKPRKLEKNN
jgi:hypothetical protein